MFIPPQYEPTRKHHAFSYYRDPLHLCMKCAWLSSKYPNASFYYLFDETSEEHDSMIQILPAP